jgi:hypothetical protein
MKHLIDVLEPRVLLSAVPAGLAADIHQLQADTRAAHADAAACGRSLGADVRALSADISHLPHTPQNRALLQGFRRDELTLLAKMSIGLNGLITNGTRDSNKVAADERLVLRQPSNTAAKNKLAADLAKLQNDVSTAQVIFGNDASTAQTTLDADLDALAAANPSDAQLQTDAAKAKTDLANCINKLKSDADQIQADIDKIESDLGGQPSVTGTFTDITFNDQDWETVAVPTGPGGTAEAHQVTTGGDVGPYRQITIALNTPSATEDSQVVVFNGKLDATWNSATQGAIASVDYSEFAELIVGHGQGHRTGAAVKQNGHVYFALTPAVFTPETTWTQKMQTGLTANDFVELGTSNHPDFSASGGVLEFGFYRALSSPAGNVSSTRTGGIDNWAVTIHT